MHSDTKPHAELPPLDLTDADREESLVLALPQDLQPDGLLDVAAWWMKIMRWMGASRVCRERQLLAALQSIAALTARAEKAEREMEENFADAKAYSEAAKLQRERAEAAEAELAAVHKRLDAISEEDRMTRNANS